MNELLRIGIVCAAALASEGNGKWLVPPDAKLEKIVGDLRFSEGPAWHPDGYLFFEDIPRNRIMKLEAGDKISVFREPSGHSNGLAFDKEGRLIAAEGNSTDGGPTHLAHRERRSSSPLADRYNGKRLNSPNDLAIDAQGRIYFTDPRYGSQDGVEQDKESVYRIDPDGKLRRIIDSVSRPNGIAIAPDQKTLYVANNREGGAKRVLLAFDLGADGSAKNSVENARRRARIKHGGGRRRQELQPDLVAAPGLDEDMLALDASLVKFAAQHPVKSRLVELRFFAGLTGDEAADILGISPSTADRDWVFARAWLRRELEAGRIDQDT